jgi:hypothetical protein
MSDGKGKMVKETVSNIVYSGPETNVYSPCRQVKLFGHVILVEGYDPPEL